MFRGKDRLVETFREWQTDEGMRLAAAVSFYAIFSVAPLIIITFSLAGVIFGEQAARGQILAALEPVIDRPTADAVQRMIKSASSDEAGRFSATFLGIIVLLIAASSVFRHLKLALNKIWDVPERATAGWIRYLRDRLVALFMVVCVGVFLLLSVALSILVGSLEGIIRVPIVGGPWLWRSLHFVLFFLLVTLVFAAIYRWVPDIDIRWRKVWGGAVLAAFLFSVGQWLLSLYIVQGRMTSAYGAAGSLVILLVWIYFTTNVLFFGAAFAEVGARGDAEVERQREESRRENPKGGEDED